jgi:hypothetical protein
MQPRRLEKRLYPLFRDEALAIILIKSFLLLLFNGSCAGLPDFFGPNIPKWEKYNK